MKIVDLEPKLYGYKPLRNAYEVYVNIHVNYEDEDDPFGPRRYDFQMVINNKLDAMKAMEGLLNLHYYILSESAINQIKYEPLRQQVYDIFVNREDDETQLFLSHCGIAYYDEYGRKCPVDIKEA